MRFWRTTAVASHILVGDGPDKWGAPLGFAVVTLASWALRPPGRRIAGTAPAAETRAVAWIVPIVILVVLLVLSLVALPKGPTRETVGLTPACVRCLVACEVRWRCCAVSSLLAGREELQDEMRSAATVGPDAVARSRLNPLTLT
jgi:hypothetical protein